MILEKINKPNDIKKLSPIEYNQLAAEIREFLIQKISVTGGHLASNLGVVELTMPCMSYLICHRISLYGMLAISLIHIRYLQDVRTSLTSLESSVV